ncbi:MAG: ABC transporter ATP-binding protein [Candidatus Saccharibacteria bacterium]
MTTTAVKIEDVTIVLGKHLEAVKHIDLELGVGQIIGFIGPSGAGKTTLIRAIVGRQKYTSGKITVLGSSAGTESLRHEVSYMTQEASVYSDLSVKDNLSYFATMCGIHRKNQASEIERLLGLVDLMPQAKQVVGSLSGGQKQRLSLAIALIGRPKLLVLDEPTVGLDPVLRTKLWDLFRKLSGNGVTLIISSHVMDEAEHCDDLVLIRDGVLLAHESPKELCKRTKSRTVEESFIKLVGDQS